ncbi:MAG: hypothetical protein P4L35_10785, partial [Ignavibacteriaceae bacterium]|nr:hypothetical protein [Ignavibacteriaceae bacterium]
FRLLIVDRDNAIEGAVFDDLICEYVKPICGECRTKLGCSVSHDDGDQEVDKLYFQRFISRQSQSAG